MPLYYEPPRLACWGDSLTIGLSSALAQTLGGSFRVENYGVGGETSTQIAARFAASSSATKALPALIWAGRNDFSSPSTVLSNIAAIVAGLAAGTDYLVLSVVNGEHVNEYVGGTDYANIATINAGLATAYGSRYVDLRAWLIRHANPSVSQDLTDVTHDIVPSSLRYDAVHLSPAGYALAATAIAAVLTAQFIPTGQVLDLPLYAVANTPFNRIGLGTQAPITRLHLDADYGYGPLVVSNYAKHATAYTGFGVSGQSSGIINGDATGDVCWVGNTPGRFRVSADNGGRTDLAIRNSDGGVEVPSGILELGSVTLTSTQLTALLALI